MYATPLLFTTACADPASPPHSGNFCLPPAPTEKSLRSYYDFLSTNDKVISGGKFCSFSPELYDNLWDKLREAEKTGLPPTAALPQSFYNLKKEQINIDVTREEAYQIYAAHVAHSLWVEKNKMVPWSLLDYNEKQIEDLLQPKAWFNSWNDQKEEYSFQYLLDHSPRETFQIANESVSSFSNQKSALIDIIKSVRPFRHGRVPYYDSSGNPAGDPQEITTLAIMDEEKVSRWGCQSMSPCVVQLANALNIPGETLRGYYSGENHRSALFEFTDQVLAHGDDVYGAVSNTPSSELLNSYDYWKRNVFIYPKGDPTAAHNTLVHEYQMDMKYPSQYLTWGYCTKGGKKYLDFWFVTTKFGPFATNQELYLLEKKLLDRSENCTVFPEDNFDH